MAVTLRVVMPFANRDQALVYAGLYGAQTERGEFGHQPGVGALLKKGGRPLGGGPSLRVWVN